MNVPLLLLNPQTANLNMEIHIEGLLCVHEPQTTIGNYVPSTVASASVGLKQHLDNTSEP